MYFLAILAALIAAAAAKPTDSVVSVSQDNLGNYDIKYAVDGPHGSSKVEQRSVRGGAVLIEPQLRAEHIVPTTGFKVVEVPQIPAVRSSHIASVQHEIPVIAEPNIDLPTYKVLEVPAVRTLERNVEVPSYKLVSEIPAVRSSHVTVQHEIPLESEIELPTYKVVQIPEIPAVRSSHYTTVQKELPVELQSYKIVEVPSVRSSHVTLQEEAPLLSLPAHSVLRTVHGGHFVR